jgi:hypothetical protein
LKIPIVNTILYSTLDYFNDNNYFGKRIPFLSDYDNELYFKTVQSLDIIMGFNQLNDVQMVYTNVFHLYNVTTEEDIHELIKAVSEKRKSSKPSEISVSSTWISSRYRWRKDIFELLGRFLPFDHFGSFLNNGLNGDLYDKSHQNNYKFIFSFENGIERDYVTEKFYEGLVSGRIMVYLGAPNIEDYSPCPKEKVFINALEYTPFELINLINELNNDDKKYEEYFSWYKKPVHPNFIKFFKKGFFHQNDESWHCRVCEYFHKRFD